VISADLDGAELRREKRKNPYHVRCDGKADDQDINDAIQSVNKSARWTILADVWERIFGERDKP